MTPLGTRESVFPLFPQAVSALMIQLAGESVPAIAIKKGVYTMIVRYTCSDVCLSMVRDAVVLRIDHREDVCSDATWIRVKRIFARRHHTKAAFVDITAVETVQN